jgi:hypothetical protein
LLDGLKVPVLLVVKLTVPLGVVGEPEVSVTIAVQLVAVPEVTDGGAHATVVAVLCSGAGVEARTNVPWLDE